ncbi:MAG: hypothetical protein JWP78_2943 [Mucilaginibacter sp.]|nr:hypothetical protein [Mucilaginibacter sp.]
MLYLINQPQFTMDDRYKTLHAAGSISDESFERQNDKEVLLSVHGGIKTLLYPGVLLLTAGLGVLIWKLAEEISAEADQAAAFKFST